MRTWRWITFAMGLVACGEGHPPAPPPEGCLISDANPPERSHQEALAASTSGRPQSAHAASDRADASEPNSMGSLQKDAIVPPPETPPPTGLRGDQESTAVPAALDEVPSFVALFRRLSPSVVNIYTQEVVQRRLPDAFGGEPLGLVGTSLGSGMILDTEGYILTNGHVVENAAEIRVRFSDESEMPARLIGIDPVRDLALIKVDGARALVPVIPGDSAALPVGAWVVAIGNPFGLAHTITKGIVSGKGRSEQVNGELGYLDLIQTDAAINQGSSGGPLFDMAGHVVGVNTAVSAGANGIGFAIGWNAVREALPRLLQGGYVSRSWLGVYVRQDGGGQGEGRVLVDAVVDRSPAAQAGLQPGDILVAMDGRPVRDVAEFRLRVASAVAGREMTVEIERLGERVALTARLEEARDVR